MKGMRIGIAALFITVLALACSPCIPVKAEDGEYTYTVRFYSGQQGTFAGGQDVITYEGLSYGSVVTFHFGDGNVVLNDGSKYYIKGIRESGRDNNTVSASSFVVTGDKDYVVAYGLRGNTVAYTVNYLDVSGNAIAPSETYYGNVGDKPVVAFLYIEGYQPQAYNLTKTLTENEAENIFTFVYTPIAAGDAGMTTSSTQISGTGRSVVEVIPGDEGRRISGYRTEEDADPSDIDIEGELADVTGETMAEPPESIDLDGIELEDPAVPLADMKFRIGPVEVDARMLLIVLVVLTDIMILTAASTWYWKPYRKKEDDEKNVSQAV